MTKISRRNTTKLIADTIFNFFVASIVLLLKKLVTPPPRCLGMLYILHKMCLRDNVTNCISTSCRQKEKIKLDLGISYQNPKSSRISAAIIALMITGIHKTKSMPTFYVDDGSFIVEAKNILNLQYRLQHALSIVGRWSNKWGFTIAQEETVGAIFGKIIHRATGDHSGLGSFISVYTILYYICV